VSMTKRSMGLAMAIGLSLMLPLGASAQSDAEDVTVPELDGLAWYRTDELTGTQMQETLPEDEVADWATLVESVGATFEDLEYTYQEAFDPAALPSLGGIATVQVAGADTKVLRTAVVADIVGAIVGAGLDEPTVEETTLAGKDVVRVEMPEGAGHEDAVVYASGDVAWALVIPSELAEAALEQLP